MNIFEELKPQIEAFKATRDHLVACASLPQTGGAISFGSPPFVIDGGSNYYAVIHANGEVSPLPFGYQIPNEEFETDGVDAVYIPVMAGGMTDVSYVPLAEDFEVPGDRAFCLETAEDSEAWEAVGKVVESIQQMVNEKALFNFNQRLSNALISIYQTCDALESVDQTISALFLEPSVLSLFLHRSYQYALDELAEEMSAEEEDEDEQ